MNSAPVKSSEPAAWLPAVLLALLCAALLLGAAPLEHLLRYDRMAVDAGAWWRLVTANFVHLGVWHALLNGLSLLLLVLLCPERQSASVWLARLLWLSLAVTLGLHFFEPALRNYVGLSGIVYGLFALGFGRQALAGDRFGAACLLFVIGRVGWELTAGSPAFEERLIGGRVVAESHLWGVIGALAYGTLGVAFGRVLRSEPIGMPDDDREELQEIEQAASPVDAQKAALEDALDSVSRVRPKALSRVPPITTAGSEPRDDHEP